MCHKFLGVDYDMSGYFWVKLIAYEGGDGGHKQKNCIKFNKIVLNNMLHRIVTYPFNGNLIYIYIYLDPHRNQCPATATV